MVTAWVHAKDESCADVSQLQHLHSRDSPQKPGSAAIIAIVWMWSMHGIDTLPSHEVDAEALQGQAVG